MIDTRKLVGPILLVLFLLASTIEGRSHVRNASPKPQPILQDGTSTALRSKIAAAARGYFIPPGTLYKLIKVESDFQPHALGRHGERGLMQVLPATARLYGVRDSNRLYDVDENLIVGCRFLRDLLWHYQGDLRLALEAYNRGPDYVDLHRYDANFRTPYALRVIAADTL